MEKTRQFAIIKFPFLNEYFNCFIFNIGKFFKLYQY